MTMSSTGFMSRQPILLLSPLAAHLGSGSSDPVAVYQPPASHGATTATRATQEDGGAAATQNRSRTEWPTTAIRGGSGGARGGGNASEHQETRNMSVASESRLTGGREPSVQDRLQPTLEAAKRGYVSTFKTVMAHWIAMGITAGLLVVLGIVAYVLAGALHGRQRNIAIAVLGAVLNLIAFCFVVMRVRREPEASFFRMCELEEFRLNLDSFMVKHGHRRLSTVGPEVEAKMTWNMGRLNEIMGVKSN